MWKVATLEPVSIAQEASAVLSDAGSVAQDKQNAKVWTRADDVCHSVSKYKCLSSLELTVSSGSVNLPDTGHCFACSIVASGVSSGLSAALLHVLS